MQQLQISERTFCRYLEVIFANDRRLLAENIDDTEFLNQMVVARDRLLEQRRDVLEMAHDPEIDDQVRINAHHLAAEIAAAVLRIYEGGPAILSQRHAFPRTSMTGPGTTGVRLVLKKKEDEEQDPSERQRMEAAGEYRRRQRQLHLQRREGEREYDELDDGEQEEEESRLSEHCKT